MSGSTSNDKSNGSQSDDITKDTGGWADDKERSQQNGEDADDPIKDVKGASN